MNSKDFSEYSESFMNKCFDLLHNKSNQYSPISKFHNFEQGASIVGEEKERVLFLYMLKHLVYIKDFFTESKTIAKEDIPKMQESIMDIINYFILLSAMLKEKFEE